MQDSLTAGHTDVQHKPMNLMWYTPVNIGLALTKVTAQPPVITTQQHENTVNIPSHVHSTTGNGQGRTVKRGIQRSTGYALVASSMSLLPDMQFSLKLQQKLLEKCPKL